MARLTVEAHCLSAEFEAQIFADHGIVVIDSGGAPWEVTFEGTVEGLVAMYEVHWGDMDPDGPKIIDVKE